MMMGYYVGGQDVLGGLMTPADLVTFVEEGQVCQHHNPYFSL